MEPEPPCFFFIPSLYVFIVGISILLRLDPDIFFHPMDQEVKIIDAEPKSWSHPVGAGAIVKMGWIRNTISLSKRKC